MEDKDTRITEVYLNANGSATLGKTDGPVFTQAQGSWNKQGNTFKMTLVRTYEAGKEKGTATDMGEFTFSVERTYTGDLSMVGGKTAMSGIIHQIDDVGSDREVGFFNMIDTTKERLGEKDENA